MLQWYYIDCCIHGNETKVRILMENQISFFQTCKQAPETFITLGGLLVLITLFHTCWPIAITSLVLGALFYIYAALAHPHPISRLTSLIFYIFLIAFYITCIPHLQNKRRYFSGVSPSSAKQRN